MNNYKVLVDEEKFDEFVDWLPDLEPHEKFYSCLFARKKYCPEVPWIKSDKGQLKRFLSDKDLLKRKIKQLEVPFGAYDFKGNPFPQESLALYISPNPRDCYKATLNSISHFVKLIACKKTGFNPQQEAMSEIQKSKSYSRFVTFDIDNKDENLLDKAIELCDGYCDVIETRGGYHVHVLSDYKDKIKNKMWYPEIKKFSDVTGDAMTPIVGCTQGGFIPFFKYRYDERI